MSVPPIASRARTAAWAGEPGTTSSGRSTGSPGACPQVGALARLVEGAAAVS